MRKHYVGYLYTVKIQNKTTFVILGETALAKISPLSLFISANLCTAPEHTKRRFWGLIFRRAPLPPPFQTRGSPTRDLKTDGTNPLDIPAGQALYW